MKVLIDMNLSPMLADILSANGVAAEHWSRIGAPNAKDAEITEKQDLQTIVFEGLLSCGESADNNVKLCGKIIDISNQP